MKNKEERRYRINRKGFTLIELLVVMVILAMLAAIVGPKLFTKVGKGKQSAAKTQIEMLGQALDSYRLDTGHYPNTSEGLKALVTNPGDRGMGRTVSQKGAAERSMEEAVPVSVPRHAR